MKLSAAASPAPSRGLPPILPPRGGARVMILGSLPGAVSIAQRMYYAHPRNDFWRVMMDLAEGDPEWPYPRKIDHLRRAGVALWDVLAQAVRRGSLDSAIRRESEKPNPIARVVAQNPGLRAVAANGQAAAALYRRHILPTFHRRDSRRAKIPTLAVLPSTSPANARLSFDRKLALWRAVLGPILRK